jgi:Ca2+/H+ antiporter
MGSSWCSRPGAIGAFCRVRPGHSGRRRKRTNHEVHNSTGSATVGHTLLLVITMLPIVLLAKQLAKLIDHGIAVLEAPPALGGVLIALIVFTPEAIAALRAALDNQL